MARAKDLRHPSKTLPCKSGDPWGTSKRGMAGVAKIPAMGFDGRWQGLRGHWPGICAEGASHGPQGHGRSLANAGQGLKRDMAGAAGLHGLGLRRTRQGSARSLPGNPARGGREGSNPLRACPKPLPPLRLRGMPGVLKLLACLRSALPSCAGYFCPCAIPGQAGSRLHPRSGFGYAKRRVVPKDHPPGLLRRGWGPLRAPGGCQRTENIWAVTARAGSCAIA